MSSAAPTAAPVSLRPTRLRIFVDFWNFQLTINEEERLYANDTTVRFEIDWLLLPQVLTAEAAKLLSIANYTYEGMSVYTSFDPKSPDAGKYKKWATTWLDRQPGVQVKCFERRPKNAPKCRKCKSSIDKCPNCTEDMAGTVEKGVDTAIATDMIRFAWEDAYDVAILASADADLIPAVEFLDLRGKRTINAGFPPSGMHLSTACWATINTFSVRNQFRRP
jgi:uncharacterized LabA/DUF88 family protein